MAGAVHILHPSEELMETEAFSRRLDALLKGAEAHPDRPVGVAGAGALDLMCALWGRGFQRVEAARRCTCGCADEMCDVLLVSGTDPFAIAATVEATGALLRHGGRLGVLTPSLRGAEERQRLLNLLALRGFRNRMKADGPLVLLKPEADEAACLD